MLAKCFLNMVFAVLVSEDGYVWLDNIVGSKSILVYLILST